MGVLPNKDFTGDCKCCLQAAVSLQTSLPPVLLDYWSPSFPLKYEKLNDAEAGGRKKKNTHTQRPGWAEGVSALA